MALPRVSPELSPAENVRRFDAAFQAIDESAASLRTLQSDIEAETNARLAGDDVNESRRRSDADAQAWTLAAAVTEEARVRQEADAAETRARQEADAAEAAARRDADAAEAKARLAADEAHIAAMMYGSHPGLAPSAFSNACIGSLADLDPLDPAQAIATGIGPAWRIDGAGIVARRAAILVDPDAIWIVQARYWRHADVLDPNNNAVDLGPQWLDPAGGDLGTTLLYREANLRVQDGPRILTVRVPSLREARPVVAPPPGAVSWRPYLRTYGSDGAAAVSRLGARDVTFAGAYVPDVADIAARLGRIEGQLAAGLPLSAPILPSYAVADLPKPGARGRKAFALDGRAPNAAGSLEAANAGTGVEVTDNGLSWVITGTNQQVKA